MSISNLPAIPEEHSESEPNHEMVQAMARTATKFAESSDMEYTEHESKVLFAPVDPDDVLMRPDGELYLEHAWYRARLDAAFGHGNWSLMPAPWSIKAMVSGNITYREYVLWVRGKLAANAYGSHEEKRKTGNIGDALEALYADALKRCCKHLGMAIELWTVKGRERFKAHIMAKRKSAPPSIERPAITANALKIKLMESADLDELREAWDAVIQYKVKLGTDFAPLETLKNEIKKRMSEEPK